MFDIGFGEMLFIAILILVFVGPDHIPELMSFTGRYYGKFRRASDDLRRTFNAEVARVESDRRRDELKQRQEEIERRRKEEAPAPEALPPEAPVAADEPPVAAPAPDPAAD